MTQINPNPWNFHNADKELVSVNNYFKVVYYDLNEIAMGAPIGGQCFLETPDNKKVKIHDWCGGPPAWKTDGKQIAIPIWTGNEINGTVQQIGVLDTLKMELKIFSKTFSVLHIYSFDKTTIYGFDGSNHNSETVTFNIEEESVETVIKLKK